MYFFKVVMFSIVFFFNQQLSQGAYNTKENRPHFVMANEIRAEVSLKLHILSIFILANTDYCKFVISKKL